MPLFGGGAYDIAKEREAVPFDEQLRALEEVVKAGKVRGGIKAGKLGGEGKVGRHGEGGGFCCCLSLETLVPLHTACPYSLIPSGPLHWSEQ